MPTLMESWAMFRNLVRALSRSFQEGIAIPLIGLISFVWILAATDRPLSPDTIIGAGFMAILAMGLIGWLVGLAVVLLDGILEIISLVIQDIRAASDTPDKPPRRPLP